MGTPLDELVKRFVEPAIKDAGFQRLRARHWWTSVPDGHAAFMRIRPYALEAAIGFHIEAAAVPAVLREYHDRSASVNPVEFDWGLIRARITAPEQFRTGLSSSLWGVQLDRVDVDGPKLHDYFQDVVMPRWKSLLDPTDLVRAAYGEPLDDFRVMHRYGPYFGKVIMEIDDGEPRELDEMIDNLISRGADGDLLEWLRQRLHQRL